MKEVLYIHLQIITQTSVTTD